MAHLFSHDSYTLIFTCDSNTRLIYFHVIPKHLFSHVILIHDSFIFMYEYTQSCKYVSKWWGQGFDINSLHQKAHERSQANKLNM